VRSDYDYISVVSFETFNSGVSSNLFINVGLTANATQVTTAGQYFYYNYNTDGYHYLKEQLDEKSQEWWNEGNGRFVKIDGGFKNMLINVLPDTRWWSDDDKEVFRAYDIFCYDEYGTAIEWGFAYLPPVDVSPHLYDVGEFQGNLLISMGNGVLHRLMPTSISGHDERNVNNWSGGEVILGTAPSTRPDGHATHSFRQYRNHYAIFTNDTDDTDRLVVVRSIDKGVDDSKIVDLPKHIGDACERGGRTEPIEFDGRLVLWNHTAGGDPAPPYNQHNSWLYFSKKTVDCTYECIPSSGEVPFTTCMRIRIDNNCWDGPRHVATRIDLTLANGTYYPNWQSGHTNIMANDYYETQWNQTIPALGTLLGLNRFALKVADVTPIPYNQPPYLPSGDTERSICVVEGITPR